MPPDEQAIELATAVRTQRKVGQIPQGKRFMNVQYIGVFSAQLGQIAWADRKRENMAKAASASDLHIVLL
jgi:hypothetical protein